MSPAAAEPGITRLERIQSHAGSMVLAGLGAAALSLGVPGERGIALVAFSLAVVLLGTAILFTRPLDDRNRLRALFRFAYGFAFLASFGPALLILLDKPLSISPRDGASAVAILEGCPFEDPGRADPEKERGDEKEQDRQIAAVPSKAQCGNFPPQWVVTIGGMTHSHCRVDGQCEPRPDDLENALQLEKEAEEADRKADRAEAASRRADAAFSQAEALLKQSPRSPLLRQDAEAKQKTRNAALANAASLRETAKQKRKEADAAARSGAFEDNLEGLLITGGLVVPVYFVILAILGATVGMLRKLPEFQNRSTARYERQYLSRPEAERDAEHPPLSRNEARDRVIFQVAQIITALPIALVAYAWAQPGNPASTSVLGFAAGFSSEIFLVALRATAERLIGLGLRAPATRARVAPAIARPAVRDGSRGPAAGAHPASLEGIGAEVEEGARLQLAQAQGIFLPGSKVIVRSVSEDGSLWTEIYENHAGRRMRWLLPPKHRSFFAPLEAELAGDEVAPVG